MMGDYEQKVEARRRHYIELAEKYEAESDRLHREARELADQVPLGQPILVDHHSARRMRRHQERLHRLSDKALEASRKAEHYRRKAEAVGTGGVSSLDDDAVQKLEAKLQELRAQQELWKGVNKAYRWALKQGHVERYHGVPYDEIPAEVAEEFARRAGAPDRADELRKYVGWKPEAWEALTAPFSGWPLKNLGARIRATEKRLEELKAAQATSDEEKLRLVIEGVVEVFEEDGRVCFKFEGIPPEEIRQRLKSRAFKWSRTRSAWVRKATGNARYDASVIFQELEKQKEEETK